MTNHHNSGTITRRWFLYSTAASLCALRCRAELAGPQPGATEALAPFGAPSQQLLRGVIEDKGFRGQIPAATVNKLLGLEPKSIDDLMLALLPLARTSSRPPLSNYFVGAVLLGKSGSLYLGANIEVPGQGLGVSVHAEQASVANAYMSGEEAVSAIAVTAAPCGHCRQFLNEMAPNGEIRVLVKGQPPVTLSQLLPMAFGPKDLGFTQGAFPIQQTKLSLMMPSTDPLVLLALDAASRSYSPYTSSPSGVAIQMPDRRTFAGSYIENAAFNPSLPALQAALAGLFAAQREAGTMVRAVLVELASTRISQQSTTRAVLSSLAPTVQLEVVKAIRFAT
jgi:cytidine deaminase